MAIPLGLRTALNSGECVLFVGAGIGYNSKDKAGIHAPTGKELAIEMNRHFKLNFDGIDDLTKISQIVESRYSRLDLDQFVKRRLADLEPDNSMLWIPKVRWKAIYTTNYDDCLEKAYSLCGSPTQEPVSISCTSEFHGFDNTYQVPILHIHGSFVSSMNSTIIITSDDYTKYNDKRKMLFNSLRLHLMNSNILYVGYSNNDSNWNAVYSDVANEYFPSPMPYSYRIDPYVSAIDEEILKSKNIETIKCTFSEFVENATIEIDANTPYRGLSSSIKSRLPQILHEAFDKNPKACVKIINCWDYVNSVDFSNTPNTFDFYRGDKANWSLISKKCTFQRDVEEEIYDSILDYITGTVKKVATNIILGAAGQGITTLLMSLATRLVNDKVEHVFFLKDNHEPDIESIEYAIDSLSGKCIFFIDGASKHVNRIYYIKRVLTEKGKNSMFLLGARTNEWIQANGTRIRGINYTLNKLSDGECERLLYALESCNELNKLKDLDQDMRLAAIKRNYDRELLVAIREATEGKPFDAIISSEFYGINSDIAKNIYLFVCCFSQHGASCRDNVISRALGIDLVRLYDITKNHTEGILKHTLLNERSGDYVLNARHRIIASVIWESCGDIALKQEYTYLALDCLNLCYSVDNQAFEAFYRSDRMVDSIRDFESRTKFFDKACRMDPDNPYIHQHYSRMLLRAGHYELALSQIETAMSLRSDIRVLYHTKGLILQKMALMDENQDIARKMMRKSEQSFRTAILMSNTDEFGYQGLAELYIDWAKYINDINEKSDYITKAATIVEEGMYHVKNKDSMWVTSSRIQEYLDNEPDQISNLERALQFNPNSRIARLLLSRVYARRGHYDIAEQVLRPAVLEEPNDYRIHIDYAIAALHNRKNYNEAISILQQSTMYGFSDPRFVATLGGMLFMAKRFAEAKDVFLQSIKREISENDRQKIYFRPPSLDEDQQYQTVEGIVKKAYIGFSYIQTTEFPDFFCPGAKYNGYELQDNMRVKFIPAFTARGNIADEIYLL